MTAVICSTVNLILSQIWQKEGRTKERGNLEYDFVLNERVRKSIQVWVYECVLKESEKQVPTACPNNLVNLFYQESWK